MSENTYSTINLFIRSSIFLVYSVSLIVACSLSCMFAGFMSLKRRHTIIRWFLYAYVQGLKYICLIDYKVEGLDNIPKDRVGIALSKHQSAWETFYLPLIFHDPAVIMKRELLWIPFFGWGLAASSPIVINRAKKSSAMQQVIVKGRKALEDDRWVLIYPEGTRVPYGQVGQYKLGGARLAAATGYPVVPVAHNAGRFWARRQFIKQPGTIRVVVGPVIESTGRTPEEILQLAKDWIELTMTRIDRLVDEPTS